MGRIVAKANPKYDHHLDLNLTVDAARAEIAGALVTGVNQKNITIEEQDLDHFVFSGRSLVGKKNIWILVQLSDGPGGTTVRTRITRAHTAAWMYLFYIPLGPSKVRAIETYKTLTRIWRENLAGIGSVGSVGG